MKRKATLPTHAALLATLAVLALNGCAGPGGKAGGASPGAKAGTTHNAPLEKEDPGSKGS